MKRSLLNFIEYLKLEGINKVKKEYQLQNT